MTLPLAYKRSSNIIAITLILAILTLSFVSQIIAIPKLSVSSVQNTSAQVANCQRQEVTQSKLYRVCPYSLTKSYLTQTIINFFILPIKTIFYLFMVGLLNSGRYLRIDRPPKFQFSF